MTPVGEDLRLRVSQQKLRSRGTHSPLQGDLLLILVASTKMLLADPRFRPQVPRVARCAADPKVHEVVLF
jgi:hypothetical protein